MSKKRSWKKWKNTFLLHFCYAAGFWSTMSFGQCRIMCYQNVWSCSGLEILQQNHAKSSIIFHPSCNMDYHLFALLRRCLESAIILGLTSWRFLSDAMAMTWNVWILCHASPPDFASLWFAIAYMYNPIIRVNHVVPKAYLNGIVSKSTCKKAGNKCLSTRRVS